jgi:hypothetical protein
MGAGEAMAYALAYPGDALRVTVVDDSGWRPRTCTPVLTSRGPTCRDKAVRAGVRN